MLDIKYIKDNIELVNKNTSERNLQIDLNRLLGIYEQKLELIKDDFEDFILQALNLSPIKQALLEEYLFGWKEFELEMMRDNKGNCVVVCAIENINPMVLEQLKKFGKTSKAF